MGSVQFFLGQPHSGKTARCLAVYAPALRAARRAATTGSTLWLTPALESRHEVLERLLPLTDGVAFQSNVVTFDQFAERVLLETDQGDRAVVSLGRRLILRSLIRQAVAEKRLTYFESIAETDGFLDVVASFISELKRAEIWPHEFHAVCRGPSGKLSPRDAELHGLYDRYQTLLLERNWYDAEGRFWKARDTLQKQSGFWRELTLVVVDGFSDFTRTQQEMLEQLALAARDVIITLPLEQPLQRHELFAKPQNVLRELEQRFARAGVATTRKVFSCDAEFPSGLRQIHDRLFLNPRRVEPAADASGCEIVAATGNDGEKAAVALRIKRLLLAGTPARDIVVGVRSATASGQEWLRALTEAGIPAWCEVPPPWSRSPFLKMLFSLLQLQLEDWPFERLQRVLNSTLFRPPIPNWHPISGPRRVTSQLRRARLHSRRATMLQILNRRLQQAPEDDPERSPSELTFALQVLTHLANACDLLTHALPLDEWANRLAALTDRLGLAPRTADDPDRRDAEQLQRLLRSAAAVEAELGPPPPQRTLEELVDVLRDVIQSDPPHRGRDASGCVRIVGAETLRHLRPRHLFLAELTEDAFPARRGEDCLYSEAERVRFHQAGLTLSHRDLHQQEEMLLFYQAVARPTVRLTLSYSRVDSQGHEVFPSPYLSALKDLFDTSEQQKIEVHEGSLDPVPETFDAILTPTDLRLAAVMQAQRKRPGWWRGLLGEVSAAPTARNVLAAAHVAQQRFRTKGFTGYEGRLSIPRHLEGLEQAFGPHHQFSATELEEYAACPFRFWMSSVLEAKPLVSPDEATDVVSRGSLIHDVLARLADENSAEAPRIAQRFRELVEDLLRQRVAESDLQQALLEAERQVMDRWAGAVAEQHVKYHERLTTEQLSLQRTLPEVPFGTAGGADPSDPSERYPALELMHGGSTIRLGGRIDRIDVAEVNGRTVFNVIDYKTGRKPSFKWDDVRAGRLLQLALYTLAVARLQIAGPDAAAHEMGYWAVRHNGYSPCGDRKSESRVDIAVSEALEALLSETIGRLVAGIRAGLFVVDSADDRCTSSCPYATVCRVNQVRSLAEPLEKFRPEPLCASDPH
jgi:ATP-dependent helicase/DNAse subunit B